MSVAVGVGPQVNKFEQVFRDDHQMYGSCKGVEYMGEGMGYVRQGRVWGMWGLNTHVPMHHG